jgi:glycosyltransferase involved in cell wall biosynthesis
MPDVGLIAMVPEVWGNPWQSRHFILTRVAQYFHVVWFNPVREWRQFFGEEYPGMSGRFHAGSRGPGFHIYNAGILKPRLHRPEGMADFLRRSRYRSAQKILRRKKCEKVILYNWRPDYTSAHDMLTYDLSCYHIDDEYSFSTTDMPIDARERKLIERVDQVFIHSPALMEKKGHINPNTMTVPNGVEYDSYARQQAEPDDLKSIPHPRIGYIGYLKTQLDFAKQTELVRRHRDWSFVYVGPKGQLGSEGDLLEKLLAEENVYYLGFKPMPTLSRYAQHMDVLQMNYKVDDYTKYIYPLKVHEFLATGNPVVASPIDSLVQFEDVIGLAFTVDEWTEKIRWALSDEARSERLVNERKRIAARHDWDELVTKILRCICEHLGEEYLERFDALQGRSHEKKIVQRNAV